MNYKWMKCFIFVYIINEWNELQMHLKNNEWNVTINEMNYKWMKSIISSYTINEWNELQIYIWEILRDNN